jgi:hypothetical protein
MTPCRIWCTPKHVHCDKTLSPQSFFCASMLPAKVRSIVPDGVVDAGFFAGNARSFIAVDAHRCLVSLASTCRGPRFHARPVRSPALGF